ncbi:hypothetical protein HYV43_04725 [Candidatus Micrarchaeota archaeon]|nr:hypothetical protein [Candidatus Micrarchaeota archaeon]
MPSFFDSVQPSVGRLAFLSLCFFLFFFGFSSAISVMQVPAVDANGKGILTTIQADVRNGSGAVYIDVEPFISVETQNSAKMAAQQAAKAAGFDLARHDVFFKIVANTEVVDGPSGGQALALLAYSEFTGKPLRSDLTATGTIEADSSIGKVGGILEKVEASQQGGIRLVLVPLGQAVQNGVDLSQYAQARWGMQIVEVKNLSESISLAFTPNGSRVDSPAHVEPPLVLENVASLQSNRVLPLKGLAENQTAQLRRMLLKLDPNSVMAQVVRQGINRSDQLVINGYYYSAANEAFLAQIQTDAYFLSNVSKSELLQRVTALEAELDAYRFFEPTETSLAWSAGARLRWFWAKERLADVRQRAEVSERALPLLQDYAASANWLSAAKQLDEIARAQGGTPVPMATWKSYAVEQVRTANQSITANPLDSESLFHLKAAQRAYAAGDYLAAAYDAAFATAFNQARVQLGDWKEGQLDAVLPKSGRLGEYSDRVWAQVYYAHALYSAGQANVSGDLLDVVNAVKLEGLSKALAQVDADLVRRIGQPIATDEATATDGIQVTTTVQPAANNSWLLLGAAAVLIALVLLAFLMVYARRPKDLTNVQRLNLLEQGLLEGRISEKTYDKLNRKYGGDASTRPKAKPVRKRHP